MEYVTKRFENTSAGISQKDTYSRQMATQGYRITSEQLEAGHHKGGEQCCLFAICIPCVFLAGRTPGTVVVTYGREVLSCPKCGNPVIAGAQCSNCLRVASSGIEQANTWNVAADRAMKKLDMLLLDGIVGDFRFDWQSLIKHYPVPSPELPPESAPERPPAVVRAVGALPMLEKIFPWCLKKRLSWERRVQREADDRSVLAEQHRLALADWKHAQNSFNQEQSSNAAGRQHLYEARERTALIEYWARLLENPIYGKNTKRAEELSYHDSQGKLILSYALPSIGELPKIEKISYSQADNRYIEFPFSDDRLKSLYRDVIIKIAFAVMYRLFQSDTANALSSVAFNGTVDSISKATGREISPCIIAVQAEKSNFLSMNFSQLEILACFEGLGGRISGDLSECSPIAAIAE